MSSAAVVIGSLNVNYDMAQAVVTCPVISVCI